MACPWKLLGCGFKFCYCMFRVCFPLQYGPHFQGRTFLVFPLNARLANKVLTLVSALAVLEIQQGWYIGTIQPPTFSSFHSQFHRSCFPVIRGKFSLLIYNLSLKMQRKFLYGLPWLFVYRSLNKYSSLRILDTSSAPYSYLYPLSLGRLLSLPWLQLSF